MVLSMMRATENNQELSIKLKSLDQECRNCAPASPLECITRCRIYRLKNELRTIREAINNPNYIKELFNVLKNKTRLHILQAIADGRYSVSKLQRELKRSGHKHSQETIIEEYLHPLMAVGLSAEARDEYYATAFGNRISEMLGCFPEFTEKLPVRSECHEETLLQCLLLGPKTFEDIEVLISPKIASRTLKRLHSTGLIETPVQRDYVFFIKTKRDPKKEIFSVIERRVYDAVGYDGISVGKLAKKTGLSRRGTYKVLHRLKGKKLVFVRRIPKTYGLTCKGEMLASVLQELVQVVEDTWRSCEQVTQTSTNLFEVGGLSSRAIIR